MLRRNKHESVVVTVAYKGSGKKAQIQSGNGKRSDYAKRPQKDAISGVVKSGKQTNKTHHDSLKGGGGNNTGKRR